MFGRLQAFLMSLRRITQLALVVLVAAGPLVLVPLLFAPPLVIGPGKFEHLVQTLEMFNFKWWLAALVVFAWLVPLGILVLWRRSQAAVIELNALREKFVSLLEGRRIPVMVDVDERIPVAFDATLDVPVSLHTDIDIDHDIEIEADIPIQTELPLDTTIQTSVFGLGNVNVPIKARLPLALDIPIRGKLRIRATDVPVSIEETAQVTLPNIEVPLRCQLRTRIDLLRNIEAAGLIDGLAPPDPPEQS